MLHGAPSAHIGFGIGKQNAQHTGLSYHNAIGASAQPVVGVADRNTGNTVGFGQFDGALGADSCVDNSKSSTAVPNFVAPKAGDATSGFLRQNTAQLDAVEQRHKAVDAVGVDAVQRVLGDNVGHFFRKRLGGIVPVYQNLLQGGLHFLKRYPQDHTSKLCASYIIIQNSIKSLFVKSKRSARSLK